MGIGCNVSIHVAVPFLKGCLMKGIITKTSLGDCKAFFSDFLAKVRPCCCWVLLGVGY
jgi:hypothetical protein